MGSALSVGGMVVVGCDESHRFHRRFEMAQRNVAMCTVQRIEILKPLSFGLPLLLKIRIKVLEVP